MNEKTYKKWHSISDDGLMKVIGKFVRHHRLNQNRSQSEVAKAAGISRSTLSLMERGEKTALASLLQVMRVLDLLYLMDNFVVKEEISPIAYAQLKKKERQRARRQPNTNEDQELGW